MLYDLYLLNHISILPPFPRFVLFPPSYSGGGETQIFYLYQYLHMSQIIHLQLKESKWEISWTFYVISGRQGVIFDLQETPGNSERSGISGGPTRLIYKTFLRGNVFFVSPPYF